LYPKAIDEYRKAESNQKRPQIDRFRRRAGFYLVIFTFCYVNG
jgi:hypothetical protein